MYYSHDPTYIQQKSINISDVWINWNRFHFLNLWTCAKYHKSAHRLYSQLFSVQEKCHLLGPYLALPFPSIYISSQYSGISTKERPRGKVRPKVLSITCWQLEWNALWVCAFGTFECKGMLGLSACVLCYGFPTASDIWLGHWVWISSYSDNIYSYLIIQNMWCDFKFKKNKVFTSTNCFFRVEFLFH